MKVVLSARYKEHGIQTNTKPPSYCAAAAVYGTTRACFTSQLQRNDHVTLLSFTIAIYSNMNEFINSIIATSTYTYSTTLCISCVKIHCVTCWGMNDR
jgi:hypothetical protein